MAFGRLCDVGMCLPCHLGAGGGAPRYVPAPSHPASVRLHVEEDQRQEEKLETVVGEQGAGGEGRCFSFTKCPLMFLKSCFNNK